MDQNKNSFYEKLHHSLKILPIYFKEVVAGRKNFEVRKNDRNYQPGETVTLNEWDPNYGYSHLDKTFKIGYVLPLDKFYGPQMDMVVFSLLEIQ